MDQTLCPYALTPLSTGVCNDEHILPSALGAPSNFTVRSLATENSRMNVLIDAPTVNDPLVRFIAMSQGVISRSGPIKAPVDGTVDGSGDAVRAIFSQDGMDVRYLLPFVKDSQGDVIGVRGFGNDANLRAEQFKAGAAKKGKLVEQGSTISYENPRLNMQLKGDLLMIRRQLFKIAYLSTVRIFGDAAIKGPSGEQLREAMMAESAEDLENTKIRISNHIQSLSAVIRTANPHEHVITCAALSETDLFTKVELFGCFTIYILTALDGIDVEVGTGEVMIIDASSSSLTSQTFLESLQALAVAGS